MSAGTAPGTPYFNITLRMQDFYAARGMWHDGRPQAALTAMLGDRAPWGTSGGVAFWVTPEQIAAMWMDICTSTAGRLLPGQVRGQIMRRMHEALKRAGQSWPQRSHRDQEAQDRPGALTTTLTTALTSVATTAATAGPFKPLVIPTHGKSRVAFQKHVMDCIHDIVEFSQTSAYGETEHPGTNGGQ